jgi:hypothetical protein
MSPQKDPCTLQLTVGELPPVEGGKADIPTECKDHVQLKVDFSSIPRSRFTKHVGSNGEDYFKINYEILATYHSAHVEYSAQFEGMAQIRGMPDGANPRLGSTYGHVKAYYCR